MEKASKPKAGKKSGNPGKLNPHRGSAWTGVNYSRHVPCPQCVVHARLRAS